MKRTALALIMRESEVESATTLRKSESAGKPDALQTLARIRASVGFIAKRLECVRLAGAFARHGDATRRFVRGTLAFVFLRVSPSRADEGRRLSPNEPSSAALRPLEAEKLVGVEGGEGHDV